MKQMPKESFISDLFNFMSDVRTLNHPIIIIIIIIITISAAPVCVLIVLEVLMAVVQSI